MNAYHGKLISLMFLVGYICCLGGSAATRSNENCLQSVLASQLETQEMVNEYAKVPRRSVRWKIADASGEHEVIASRIFRAFSESSLHSPRFMRVQSKRELHQNPKITLCLLTKIIEEDQSLELNDMWEYEVSEVLRICYDIAGIEEDGFATGLLEEFALNKNDIIAKEATKLLEYLKEYNFKSQGESYRLTMNYDDLQWLTDRWLQLGMSREEITQIFGEPVARNHRYFIYSTHRDRGIEMHFQLYFDDYLESWKWVVGKPIIPEKDK